MIVRSDCPDMDSNSLLMLKLKNGGETGFSSLSTVLSLSSVLSIFLSLPQVTRMCVRDECVCVFELIWERMRSVCSVFFCFSSKNETKVQLPLPI